ncbi:MAG: beta-mannanase [Verrucomicrobia bacterium]|nr:MAG: beta-mannanase [Verrucomicrobiota bacterium]
MVKFLCALLLACVSSLNAQTARVQPPPAGKIYHGFYWGGVGTDTHDPTEHDVTPADVDRYEKAVGAKTAWVYFSDNWFESRKFPAQMCSWIRDLGKIPYVRLMLRSDVDQKHGEKSFSLAKIIAGEFDVDLRAWARDAKNFGSPFLIEWGTEANGNWFSWNGKWNGGAVEGPKRYVAAYRHIVDLMRAEGADNLTWVWHVNWLGEPEQKWNAFENYFPGEDYCDWLALNGTESLYFKLDESYQRLTKLAQDKPILIAEFGCDIHNRYLNCGSWAKAAFEELFSEKWPRIVGFCWWNEAWQNDDVKKHDSDLIVLHDVDLTKVFRDELGAHRDKIQQSPVIAP